MKDKEENAQKMEKIVINYGGGVNSTAILSLLCQKKLDYKNVSIVFADTGAEKPETYIYIEYIKPLLKKYGYSLITVKSKEGSLYDYCKTKNILPMRMLRLCTDRWKRKPIDKYNKDGKRVIGIDFGEQKRALRYRNETDILFPLIDLEIDRNGCIEEIKRIGWKVPVKSGCWFCPYAPMKEFKELKINNPDLFNELCEMEKNTLKHNSKTIKGWFDQTKPLDKAVLKRFPETHHEQVGLCMYCFD